MKYILIDLDGTLLDFKLGEKNAFIDTIKRFINYDVNEADVNEFSRVNEFYFNEYKNGNMSRDEFHFMRFKAIYEYLDVDGDIIESDKYYINKLKYQADLFSDVKGFLNYLYPKYELYVASNGMTLVQLERMKIAGIDNYFKDYFVSENVGYNKPDKEFFEYIFNKIDNDRSEYIIIGDRLDSDILGGINCGIKTIYLNIDNSTNLYIKQDYVISSLDEVKNIL